MGRKWTVAHLETLAELCPDSGERHVQQLFQWEHDLSKGWALALLGAALAFIGTAALSLIEEDTSWRVWVFVAVAGLAVGFGAYTLKRLRDLLPEYLTVLHTFARFRDGAGP